MTIDAHFEDHVLLKTEVFNQLLLTAKRSKELEKERDGLKQMIDRASEIHKSLEVAIGQQCLPSQMPRFVSDKLSTLSTAYKQALEALVQAKTALI